MTRRPVIDRLMTKVTEDVSGCWIFSGALNRQGYGKLWNNETQRVELAHRLSFEIHVGPISDGYELDHLCHVPNCVNPAHLEPVTHLENVRRGLSGAVNQARMLSHDTCKQGHAWTPENTKITSRQRVCRTCRRASSARQNAKRRAS